MPNPSIDWSRVKRVLVVRLRSIGDTVLVTPSLIALRRFLPEAKIDILLEDWVAPVLDGFDVIDDVVTLGESATSRFAAARLIRQRNYDVVLNLHGGTTSTFLTFASGAPHRVGYEHYQYRFLHNILVGSSADFWNRNAVHSAEQHLALLGSVGVPVEDRPKTRLAVSASALRSMETKFAERTGSSLDQVGGYALIHPAAAFATKQWATDNFARVAEFLKERKLATVAVAATNEAAILRDLETHSRVPIHALENLTLSEITALASKATLFVGNDSGIAHIAAAVETPSVVVFGSSNRVHWRPWTDAPNEIVFTEFACQPCPGHTCAVFGEPRCILSVRPDEVFAAIDRVLK
jgi:lipopolysaccharide heptosyltransferase II